MIPIHRYTWPQWVRSDRATREICDLVLAEERRRLGDRPPTLAEQQESWVSIWRLMAAAGLTAVPEVN